MGFAVNGLVKKDFISFSSLSVSLLIFEFLYPFELARVSSVSKFWHYVATNNLLHKLSTIHDEISLLTALSTCKLRGSSITLNGIFSAYSISELLLNTFLESLNFSNCSADGFTEEFLKRIQFSCENSIKKIRLESVCSDSKMMVTMSLIPFSPSASDRNYWNLKNNYFNTRLSSDVLNSSYLSVDTRNACSTLQFMHENLHNNFDFCPPCEKVEHSNGESFSSEDSVMIHDIILPVKNLNFAGTKLGTDIYFV